MAGPSSGGRLCFDQPISNGRKLMLPLTQWIAQLFEQPDLTRMGHAQRVPDLNLGLGWLYYGLARVIRPETVVVIGSYRGFAPMVFGRALAENTEHGHVHFLDPSLVDDFWKDPAAVASHFASFGLENITHYRMTTQQFIESDAYRRLPPVGIVFVDGYHSAEQAHFDFEAFADRLAPDGMILMHDSVWHRTSRIYGPGRHYVHTVRDFMDGLRQLPEWQVFDLPFGDGVSLIRRAQTSPMPPRLRPAEIQLDVGAAT